MIFITLILLILNLVGAFYTQQGLNFFAAGLLTTTLLHDILDLIKGL